MHETWQPCIIVETVLTHLKSGDDNRASTVVVTCTAREVYLYSPNIAILPALGSLRSAVTRGLEVPQENKPEMPKRMCLIAWHTKPRFLYD